MNIRTQPATFEQLDALVPLFDAYRQFYQQPSNLEGARAYLQARLERDEATVFLAFDGDRALGFALLYDTFTSVAMQPLTILNDLYTIREARGHGVAHALIAQCVAHAKAKGSFRLRLRTAKDNEIAQRVYEHIGFKRDEVFYTYDLNPQTE